MSEVHNGHRKRLRDKIEKYGFESLYPHEFLEYILFASIPRKNTNDIAHRLIKEFGGYLEVFKQPKEVLMSVHGVGVASAYQIMSYAYHANLTAENKEDFKIRNLGEARDFFCDLMKPMKKEEFHVMLLDSDGNPLVHDYYSSENESYTIVPVTAIMEMILAYKPHFVLFAHNHPSGIASPSEKDIQFTNRIFDLIEKTFNITNSEHMIFAGDECYSFRQNGKLN